MKKELSKLTVVELRKFAKQKGINLKGKTVKAELVNLIAKHERSLAKMAQKGSQNGSGWSDVFSRCSGLSCTTTNDRMFNATFELTASMGLLVHQYVPIKEHAELAASLIKEAIAYDSFKNMQSYSMELKNYFTQVGAAYKTNLQKLNKVEEEIRVLMNKFE